MQNRKIFKSEDHFTSEMISQAKYTSFANIPTLVIYIITERMIILIAEFILKWTKINNNYLKQQKKLINILIIVKIITKIVQNHQRKRIFQIVNRKKISKTYNLKLEKARCFYQQAIFNKI